jgi:carboxylate-amine ligase
MDASPLPLFTGYGIELEYMIVRRGSGAVLPVADKVLEREAGGVTNAVERGATAWSNELVLHVIEMKTNGPAPGLAPLSELFLRDVRDINRHLDHLDGCLMPTAMHPWMEPGRETVLWPHDDREIYETYDRIFNCQGHGWSNLQSTHINLPFAGDAEFQRLHTAIRTLLPVMPAIAASSPLMEEELTGFMDTRLETYRHNARRIPAITGLVVPEFIRSRGEYEQIILEPMYSAIAPHDPAHVLQYEWLNSRGAIARFDRSAIEIRVLDTQETPRADLAVAAAIVAALRALSESRWSSAEDQGSLSTELLAALFLDTVRAAEEAVIRSREYLALFDFPDRHCSAGELWEYLVEECGDGEWVPIIQGICRNGCLARRIRRAVGSPARRARIEETYRVLCRCLEEDKLFEGRGVLFSGG